MLRLGIEGMTVSEVRGYGRQKSHGKFIAARNTRFPSCRNLKIEVAIADERVDDAMAAIAEAARVGKIGDGKIFVLDLENAMRIRTGEMGSDAL